MSSNESSKRPRTVHVLLGIFFLVSVILPVANLIIRMTDPAALAVFQTSSFMEALDHSLVSAALGTLVSVVLALISALTLTRARVKHPEAWVVALTLPMLIPSIAHGMGLIYLFGSNGLITNLFGASWNIYGLPGIVLGSVLYAFPPALLMIYDALRYEDCEVYDAADILGVPRASQFTHITMPFLAKPMVSTVFATFTLIITDYGVPIEVGGKYTTLSVLMYQEVIGRLNFNSGIAVGVVLIVPAIVAFIVDLFTRGDGNLGFAIHPKRIESNAARDGLALVFRACLAVFLLAPLAAFAIVGFVVKYPVNMTFTLDNINRAMVFGMGGYLFDSLLIAVLASALGTVLSWAAAYVSARMAGKLGHVVHLLGIITMAIPGLVLGLSYMLFFKGSPIYGTLAILVMVNLVHFFASPYLLAYNALKKVNSNLEAVGETLGIPKFRMIKEVFLPQTKGTFMEMASYYFVNCMVTISAVSFLANLSSMPLALLISDFDTQMLVECAALVALVIFFVNVLAKIVFYALKSRRLLPFN